MKLFIEDATSTIVMEIEETEYEQKKIVDFFKQQGHEVYCIEYNIGGTLADIHVKLKKACECPSDSYSVRPDENGNKE